MIGLAVSVYETVTPVRSLPYWSRRFTRPSTLTPAPHVPSTHAAVVPPVTAVQVNNHVHAARPAPTLVRPEEDNALDAEFEEVADADA